jgi:hypothetical protein
VKGKADMNRRPRLFAVLCVVYVIWMGVLILLYVTTVYPRRHPSAQPTTIMQP